MNLKNLWRNLKYGHKNTQLGFMGGNPFVSFLLVGHLRWNNTNSYLFKLFRAVFGGGQTSNTPTTVNIIEYVDISTLGSATDFGDLTLARTDTFGFSDGSRGIFCGTYTTTYNNTIDYITASTTGNATDFGDIRVANTRGGSAVADTTRGCITTGANGGLVSTSIDYITISTLGNSTYFGDITVARGYTTGFDDNSRGIFAGGMPSTGYSNVMDYVTIATTGNATDFGDMTVYSSRAYMGSTSDTTRGVIFGGFYGSFVSSMIYVTIQTTGNSSTFGNLTAVRAYISQGTASNDTRGLIAGGRSTSTAYTSVIEYVTIQTTGNSINFGSLSANRSNLGALTGG